MPNYTGAHKGKSARTSEKGVLIKYGITNIPVDCFHVGGYKYSNLDDAIAQAKRMAEESK
jgi:hypothetical protein